MALAAASGLLSLTYTPVKGSGSPMVQPLKAIYRNGTFILQTACALPEDAEVELLVQSPQILSPPVSDPAAKQEFLHALVERMQQNPIPADAPHLTREDLHERR